MMTLRLCEFSTRVFGLIDGKPFHLVNRVRVKRGPRHSRLSATSLDR
jgi:hypothetical protein